MADDLVGVDLLRLLGTKEAQIAGLQQVIAERDQTIRGLLEELNRGVRKDADPIDG